MKIDADEKELLESVEGDEWKSTPREFFDEITRRYPDRVNPGTVWLSAQRLA
jgi:hypothetical protein